MTKIEALYAKIPSFTCIEGCTDCCGPVPFAHAEWERIADKRPAQSIECPYSNGGCDIYAQRPFLCRLFGTVDTPLLRCPHGCKPETMLTAEEGEALTKQYAILIES